MAGGLLLVHMVMRLICPKYGNVFVDVGGNGHEDILFCYWNLEGA